MSWWTDNEAVDADGLAVMAVLATYADREGRCTPSQSTIARRLKRSRPWVCRVIRQLAEAGVLTKLPRLRENGGNTSCDYAMPMGEAPGRTGQDGARDRATPRSAGDTGACREGDSPRQPADTNRAYVNTDARPPMRARPGVEHFGTEDGRASGDGGPVEARDVGEGVGLSAGTKGAVTASWRPSGAALLRAAAIMPGIDAEAHAEMFARRSAAKGYQVLLGREDDAWLAWVAEDRVRASSARRQGSDAPRAAAAGQDQKASAHERMFAAFGRVVERNAAARTAASDARA